MLLAYILKRLITTEPCLYYNFTDTDSQNCEYQNFYNEIKVWKPNRFSKYYLIPESRYLHLWYIITGFYYEVWYIENQEQEIVHHSLVHAKYFKFPFMREKDLQIGLVKTVKKYRNKGLATNVISHIINNYQLKENKIWYITQEHNKESIKVAKKNGAKIPLNGYKKYIDIPLLRNLSIYFQ
jgi:RimJ/RimL family protein N-acetyltransferase